MHSYVFFFVIVAFLANMVKCQIPDIVIEEPKINLNDSTNQRLLKDLCDFAIDEYRLQMKISYQYKLENIVKAKVKSIEEGDLFEMTVVLKAIDYIQTCTFEVLQEKIFDTRDLPKVTLNSAICGNKKNQIPDVVVEEPKIDLNDSKTQRLINDLGKFAINEYRQQMKISYQYKLDKIVKAQVKSIEEGNLFEITVVIKSNDYIQTCIFDVLQEKLTDTQDTQKMIFNAASCGDKKDVWVK